MTVEFLEIEELFDDLQRAVGTIEELYAEHETLEPYDIPAGGAEGKAASVPIFTSDRFAEDGEHEYDVADGIMLTVRIWATADRWGAVVDDSVYHAFEYQTDLSPDDAVEIMHAFNDHLDTFVYAVTENADGMYDMARKSPRVAVLVAELAPVVQLLYDRQVDDPLDE